MTEAQTVDAPVQEEYFGFQRTEKFMFPDGFTFIEFKILNEGDRVKYERAVAQDVTLERTTGNAKMKLNAPTQRHELIKATFVNWNLVRNGQPVAPDARNLNDFLQLADPRLIDDLFRAVQRANDFILGEMTVEEIDKQIEDLQEMRSRIEERNRGE